MLQKISKSVEIIFPVGDFRHKRNARKDAPGGIIRNIGELDEIIQDDGIRRPAIFFMFVFINELEIIVDDINKWQNERSTFLVIADTVITCPMRSSAVEGQASTQRKQRMHFLRSMKKR
jgi:hypothetical protein